jgi:K+-transporting ATPase ATPase A chain
MGNYYLDMWRVVAYVFFPASLVMGVVLLADGMPMTFDRAAIVTTLEPGAMGTAPDGRPRPQVIARGPVAALLPIKHLGTNGGGFFGANSTHPYENPGAWSNFLASVNILIFPFSLVVMFGRMLAAIR